MIARTKRALVLVLRSGLGALFVVAGAQKWRDPTAFATDIANYQLLPALAPLLAATLPAAEIVAGLVLLGPWRRWRRAAAAAIGTMMVVFTVAAASALGRGIDVTCGCFGTGGGDTISGLTIVRDLALIAAAGVVVWWEAEGITGSREGTEPEGTRAVR